MLQILTYLDLIFLAVILAFCFTDFFFKRWFQFTIVGFFVLQYLASLIVTHLQ